MEKTLLGNPINNPLLLWESPEIEFHFISLVLVVSYRIALFQNGLTSFVPESFLIIVKLKQQALTRI